MSVDNQPVLSRRRFQRLALAAASPLALAAAWRALPSQTTATVGAATPTAEAASATPTLPPTPACGDDDDLDLTEAQTEGPYFTPNSPERASLLEPDMAGTHLIVEGYVYSTGCEPVAGALLDIWQADDAGQYDNAGFRLRGHQFTDEHGFYRLETIVPGLYPGRTRHIHVKVQAPNGPVLTSQLYFPDVPENATDGIYDPDLEVEIPGEPATDGTITAFFTFVIETA